MNVVRQLPPKLSSRIRVNLESLQKECQLQFKCTRDWQTPLASVPCTSQETHSQFSVLPPTGMGYEGARPGPWGLSALR